MNKSLSFCFLTVALLLLSPNLRAENNFGIGIQLGDPTGIIGRYKLSHENSIDGAIGTGSNDDLNIHVDYLWHQYDLFKLDRATFDGYLGAGARIRDRNNDNNKNNNDENGTAFGPRGVAGFMYQFNKVRIEVFLELAVVVDITPATDGDVDLALGGRYFF